MAPRELDGLAPEAERLRHCWSVNTRAAGVVPGLPAFCETAPLRGAVQGRLATSLLNEQANAGTPKYPNEKGKQ